MRQEVKDRRLFSVNKLEIRMSDTRSRSVPRTFEKQVFQVQRFIDNRADISSIQLSQVMRTGSIQGMIHQS